jgi:hypothetical protein
MADHEFVCCVTLSLEQLHDSSNFVNLLFLFLDHVFITVCLLCSVATCNTAWATVFHHVNCL